MSILGAVGANVKRAPGSVYEAVDKEFEKKYPGIYEFLAKILVGKEERKPGAVILKYEGGKVNLCLSDAHTGSVAFHVADSITKALEGAEERLQAGRMDWREGKKGWVKR